MKDKKPSIQIVVTLIMSMLLAMTSPMASADVVGTKELLTQSEVESKRSQLSSELARDDVRAQLAGMGVSSENIQERIDALTDAEVIQLSESMDEMPAGGVFGAIISILVILILLDVAGATDIFPRI